MGTWGRLVAALDGMGLPAPLPKGLRDLRRRVGIALCWSACWGSRGYRE